MWALDYGVWVLNVIYLIVMLSGEIAIALHFQKRSLTLGHITCW